MVAALCNKDRYEFINLQLQAWIIARSLSSAALPNEQSSERLSGKIIKHFFV
jgi:hypothetical protein